MANERVVVRRNKDDTALRNLFGNQMEAAARSSEAVGSNMFQDEPWDFSPTGGASTFRGSRNINKPDGIPEGSPADVVSLELMRSPELLHVDTRNIHPRSFVENANTSNIRQTMGIKKESDVSFSVALPPTQEDSIPEEFRDKMKHCECGQNANDGVPIAVQAQSSTIISRPRQFTPEDVPGGSDAYHPAPPPPPKADVVLRPTQREMPRHITEDMIIQVYGYNETNMYLLKEVSRNIATCSEIIANLNNLSKPVNLSEIIKLLEYMDQETLRKTIAATFNDVLKTNMNLSKIITQYLSGNPNEHPESVIPSTSESGNSEQSSGAPSQDAPGNSVSPVDESVEQEVG